MANTAFQRNAFQWTAFQVGTTTVSATTLALPVNCVLVETVRVSEWEKIFEDGNGAAGEQVTLADGGRIRLSSNTHSFTSTTRQGFH